MLYEFDDVETGERVTEWFPMSEAPALDSVIEVDGRKLRRVVSGQVEASALAFKPFASEQIDRYHPNAPRVDSGGRAVFHSEQEVKRFTQSQSDKGTGMVWDR